MREEKESKEVHAGQPPFYETPKEMEDKIIEYFKNCPDTRSKTSFIGGELVKEQIEVPTISGLALYLGFCSRQSMYDYEKNPKFSYTIKKARSMMSMIYEQIGMTNECASGYVVFMLKQFGFTDKHEIETTEVKTIKVKRAVKK